MTADNFERAAAIPAAGMAPSGEPKAWYYEERHTDAQGTFWSRHLDYKRPEESPRRRNITPLFLAPDVVSPAAESPSKFSPGPAPTEPMREALEALGDARMHLMRDRVLNADKAIARAIAALAPPAPAAQQNKET